PFGQLQVSFVWGQQRIPTPVGVPADVVLTPDYPADVLMDGEQGLVQIALVVSADGEILSSRLRQRSGFTKLDELSMQLATNRNWSVQLQGRPSPTLIQVQVNWKKPP